MRDMTFANAVGFPINSVEKIGYIRSLLSKAQAEKQPEKAVSPVPAPSEPRHNYRITEEDVYKRQELLSLQKKMLSRLPHRKMTAVFLLKKYRMALG